MDSKLQLMSIYGKGSDFSLKLKSKKELKRNARA
jgi:hypothetical protein